MITLQEISHEYFQVVYDNGIWLGTIYKEVDGFYVFWPADDRNGFWVSHIMRLIADTLEGMNEPWQHTIDNDPALQIEVEIVDDPNLPEIDYDFATRPPGKPKTT